ncbi:amidohydrolase [Nocardia sp. NBC_01388]|uniref:amidohydrolase n=1 Tax=Nocardia sp. NBC_01388 TaxID=2903596 RepID=UPI00324A3E6C
MSRILLTGATVWAESECIPTRAWLLIDNDRIAAVGDQEPPPADTVVDVTGAHILPGFVDVHLHMSHAAWIPHGGDGSEWRSTADAVAAVRAEAAAIPDAPWLLFWNVARWRWPQGRLPTATELEEAAPGRRVLLCTDNMHRGSASPAALEVFGSRSGQFAGFGEDVTRDRRGRATGELWESAFGVVLRHALADSTAHIHDSGTAAMLVAEADRYLAYGITHAHDPYVSPDDHERMTALHRAGPLHVSWATGSPGGMHSRPAGPAEAPDGPYGDSGREVKVFADGGDRLAIRLPSRAMVGMLAGALGESRRQGALGPLREALRRRIIPGARHLHTPYLLYTDTELADLISAYVSAGIRPRIHALGNLAAAQTAAVLRQLKVPQDAATIDHLMLLDPATTEQVAATGVGVSYQPGFLPRYGGMLDASNAGRYVTMFGARTLIDGGVRVAISSDHPSGPVDPLWNLRAAVDRRIPGGATLQPEQALSQQEAVRAYTITAAASLGGPRNGLASGEPADFVVCDGHPFESDTTVTQTWIGGRRVWPATKETPEAAVIG